MNRHVPHLHIVVAACFVAVAGYAAFSVYAVVILRDATMTGDVIGTWKSFAVAAFAFWIGASSGGKMQEKEPGPSGKPGDPVHVEPEEPMDLARFRQPVPGEYGP